MLTFSFILLYLTFSLGYIQLVQHDRWSREAAKQRIQSLTLDYNRGDILDRHGTSLLDGKNERVLVVFPALLRHSDEEVVERVSRLFPQTAFSSGPFVALRSLNFQEEGYFADFLPYGLVVTDAWRRYGPAALATHLIGHIGPVDGEGKVGLELTFNEELKKGSPHVLAAVVDGKDRLIKGLGFRVLTGKASQAPYNLFLTIDGNIQQSVEKVMDQHMVRGAVVVMNPQNGEILAMASRPNYLQVNLPFYLDGSENNRSFLSAQPFINRSILSYPPGSIFKIIVAAAALETGQAWSNSRFYCPGYIEVGDTTFKCHHAKAHGHLNLAEAFAYSCNAVFIELALSLGRDTVYQYASSLGLGKKTGLPLGAPVQGGEMTGSLPQPEEMPFLGDLALTAIGQGRVEATPLQVARLTAAVANGGFLVEPCLVRALQSVDGETIKRFDPAPRQRVINPLTARELRLMMSGVVEDGTGQAATSTFLHLGGKTGTAETGKQIDGQPLLYSWFTGLVPAENCRAVVTIFLEEPLQGSAAGIFKKIAEKIHQFL